MALRLSSVRSSVRGDDVAGVAVLPEGGTIPHSEQNLALSRSGAPQLGQVAESAVPHCMQNLALTGFWASHALHPRVCTLQGYAEDCIGCQSDDSRGAVLPWMWSVILRNMASETREITLRAADAINRRDVEALQELLAPDGELVPMRAAMERVSFKGPRAAALFFAAVDELGGPED